MQHIHILGICGTFMAGVALLAKEKGYHVTGADANVYPPMDAQLSAQNILLMQGYGSLPSHWSPQQIIVGNALSRGKHPVLEQILNAALPYISGPQWIAEQILAQRVVLAVAGTHGKTTTTSMLAWILEYAGLAPGFLIGGIAHNFGVSARLGQGKYFVIEADEYDSAFFDKRPKFLHYRPQVLVLNNLEFDHADIFSDLAAIQQQFHYLLRTVPANGQIIYAKKDLHLQEVLAKGCWTPTTTFGLTDADWQVMTHSADSSHFTVIYQQKPYGKISWSLTGEHNIQNALAAIAAAHRVGVDISLAIQALNNFKGVKRRLEMRLQTPKFIIYEDFAHHPTAIATTLAGLRAKVGVAPIIAVVECASRSMQLGAHRNSLAVSLGESDQVVLLRPQPDWGINAVATELAKTTVCHIYEDVHAIIHHILHLTEENAPVHVVVMSNGAFGGLVEKLLLAAASLSHTEK